MNNSNQELLQRFYDAFARGDAETMAGLYHEDAVFSDPVFQGLKGSEIGMMWRMLTLQAPTLEVKARNIAADNEAGRADWSARYTFGRAKRKVHNKIHAEFTFRDGKIMTHNDHFDFWKWSRMALGPLGLFMGWNSVVKVNIRKQAMTNLTIFIERTNSA